MRSDVIEIGLGKAFSENHRWTDSQRGDAGIRLKSSIHLAHSLVQTLRFKRSWRPRPNVR